MPHKLITLRTSKPRLHDKQLVQRVTRAGSDSNEPRSVRLNAQVGNTQFITVSFGNIGGRLAVLTDRFIVLSWHRPIRLTPCYETIRGKLQTAPKLSIPPSPHTSNIISFNPNPSFITHPIRIPLSLRCCWKERSIDHYDHSCVCVLFFFPFSLTFFCLQ